MLLELADITTRATGAPAGYWQARLAQSAVAALLLFDARLAGVRGQLTVEEQASLLQQLVIEPELDMLGCSVSSYKTKYTRPILYQHAYAVLALKAGEPPQLVSILLCCVLLSRILQRTHDNMHNSLTERSTHPAV